MDALITANAAPVHPVQTSYGIVRGRWRAKGPNPQQIPKSMSEGVDGMNITLQTLHQFTAQQVFDKVAAHLLSMDGPSMSTAGSCAYRGKDGAMCAAGCLISDEEYDPEFEGRNIAWVLRDQGHAAGLDVTQMLDHLQQFTHDGSSYETLLADTARWKEHVRADLAYVASKFGLEYTP